MTDPISLFGSETDGSLDAQPVTRVQHTGDQSPMAFHLIPEHTNYGISLICITAHGVDIIRNGRVTTAANSRTVSIRPLSIEMIPKGSVKFNGSRAQAIHFLNQNMIKEEDLQEDGIMPPLQIMALLQMANLPLGTRPSSLWTFQQGIPTFEVQDNTGHRRLTYLLTWQAFPECQFQFSSGWHPGSTPDGLLKKNWWKDFRNTHGGTSVIANAPTVSVL